MSEPETMMVISEYNVGDIVLFTDEARNLLSEADNVPHEVVGHQAIVGEEGGVIGVDVVLDSGVKAQPGWLVPAVEVKHTHLVVTIQGEGKAAFPGIAFTPSQEAADWFARGFEAGGAGRSWVYPIMRQWDRGERERTAYNVTAEIHRVGFAD